MTIKIPEEVGDWFIQCECDDCGICSNYVKVDDEFYEDDELRICNDCLFGNHAT